MLRMTAPTPTATTTAMNSLQGAAVTSCVVVLTAVARSVAVVNELDMEVDTDRLVVVVDVLLVDVVVVAVVSVVEAEVNVLTLVVVFVLEMPLVVVDGLV